MVDIHADIVPAKSAAGFCIGQKLADLNLDVSGISTWSKSDETRLPDAIASTVSWLMVPVQALTEGKRAGHVYYYGNGMLRLEFSSQGILFDIAVFDGYMGRLWAEIKIGDPLALVQKWHQLEYDDGDEAHYPDASSVVQGIAYIAEECSLQDSPNQLIYGISVHDWALCDHE